MGKRIVLLSGASLFALTLIFAGCGKKEEPAPPPPPPQRQPRQRQRQQNRRHQVVK